MPKIHKILSCILGVACMAPVRWAEGRTIRVPQDQATIQAGIDAASPGDSVVVGCGTYYEYNVVMRPSIVLQGETGQMDCVVVDAMQLGRVIICPEGLGPDTRIEGLTLTGGLAMTGAGLYCDSASPSVISCAFINNQVVTITGGASCAHLFDSQATFTGCSFTNNIGPAIICSSCVSPQFINCTFYGNRSHQNDGSAMLIHLSSVSLFNCILAFSQRGSAIACLQDDLSNADLQCCNIYGNADGDWIGCIADQEGQNDNISVDPLFCDASGMNLHLCADSPCAPEQAVECGLIGALPVGCEACAPQALIPSTWGRIKHDISRRLDSKQGD